MGGCPFPEHHGRGHGGNGRAAILITVAVLILVNSAAVMEGLAILIWTVVALVVLAMAVGAALVVRMCRRERAEVLSAVAARQAAAAIVTQPRRALAPPRRALPDSVQVVTDAVPRRPAK